MMYRFKIPARASSTGPRPKWMVLPTALAFLGLAVAGGWLLGSGRILLPAVFIRATSTPTATYTATLTFTPTFTPTHTSTPTPGMIETLTIGRSVLGRPLEAVRVGRGDRVLVIAGAIHGSESGTAMLTRALRDRFSNSVSSLPAGIAVYFIPEINPDGVAGDIRFNAHNVDLNRNWRTTDWRPDPEGPYVAFMPQGGGTAPFSEPETLAMAQWLLGLKERATGGVTVVFYHSSFIGGSVQPGYTMNAGVLTSDPRSIAVAVLLVEELGYNPLTRFPSYNVTGNEIGWCAENGLACVEIEMPTSAEPAEAEIDLHFRTLWQLIGGP